MRPSTIAAMMNFALPGSGFLHLKRPLAASLNFAVAVALPILWCVGTSNGIDSVHYVILSIAAGSAGAAHAAGKSYEASRDSPPRHGKSGSETLQQHERPV